MPHTMKFWSSRTNDADPNTFIGDTDRLFFNPLDLTIRLSDGTTPGGIPIAGMAGSTVLYTNVTPPATPNGLLWFNPDIDTLSLASNLVWIPIVGAGATTLNSLSDVNIVSPMTGDALMYNAGTGKWDNVPINLGGGSANQVLVKQSGTNYDYQWEDMVITEAAYTKLLDQASATILYLGEAVPESLENQAVWRIQRIESDVNGDVTDVRFAEGGLFDQIWDNRASLNYV
jgi:hypothetical protein